jgi:hypothetical protein
MKIYKLKQLTSCACWNHAGDMSSEPESLDLSPEGRSVFFFFFFFVPEVKFPGSACHKAPLRYFFSRSNGFNLSVAAIILFCNRFDAAIEQG